MKVSLIQRSVEWQQPERNRVEAERWIARCVDSDLVVLSEMFTTGFSFAEAEREGVTLEWMQLMSAKYDVVLAGSVAVMESGNSVSYNRLYVVRQDGSYEKYDKRHLFTFAGEHRHFRAGEQRVVVEVGGVRVLLLICYDLRFPVWIRNRGGNDYDLILCVAQWSQSRRRVWDLLLRSRAVENVSYVCGVNVVGEDPSTLYSGGTAAVDFRGEVIASVADGECGVATCDVDLEALRNFRAKFPVLDDADEFELK